MVYINTSVIFVCYTHINWRIIITLWVIIPHSESRLLHSLNQPVLSFVESQTLWAAESSPADITAVRPLSCVKPEMVLEAWSSCETLWTFGTVKLLSKVDFLMFSQAARLVEAPITHWAMIGPLSCVCEPVSVHGPWVGEALPTVWAGEWFLSCVNFLMTFELTFLRELFPTQSALVRFLPRVNSHVNLQSRHLVTVSSAEPTAVRALSQIVVKLFLHRWC